MPSADFELTYEVDESLLSQRIKDIYISAGVDFEEINYFTEEINYDLDNNNLVTLEPEPKGGFGPEVQFCIDAIALKPEYEFYDGIILFFDEFQANYPTVIRNPKGKMISRYAAVFPGNMIHTVELAKTVGHEMGHGLFRLQHPWEEFNYIPPTSPPVGGSDPQNIMAYNPEGLDLKRIYQIKLIHND
jgi:hypothetical protein